MSGKKEYFPNNWEAFKDAHHSLFESCSFEEFMDWKVANWELPSSICCIIRVSNSETGKVKEIVYRREDAAQNKVRQLMQTPGIEFTVVNHDSIHHLIMKSTND